MFWGLESVGTEDDKLFDSYRIWRKAMGKLENEITQVALEGDGVGNILQTSNIQRQRV